MAMGIDNNTINPGQTSALFVSNGTNWFQFSGGAILPV
jgi:hypothetical protein